mmetsp:Transcript_44196/g.99623  ORF Transcript_44196/g.99623 Transcript_44196/m.99623 type:complete len:202 (+) Transcript_44196:61-666(+)
MASREPLVGSSAGARGGGAHAVGHKTYHVCGADIHFLVPAFSIVFLAAGTAFFVRQVPPSDEAPLYARLGLFMAALLNLCGAIPHWLLPDGGLESIARLELGGPSPARTVAIYLHAEEGLERLFGSVPFVYVAWAAPRYTIPLLGLRLAHIVLGEITLRCKPLVFEGRNLASQAPGRFRSLVSGALVAVPLLAAAWRGELR